MTSIQASRVARYVKSPDVQTRAFLLYGNDPGLIREHGAALCERLTAALGGTPETIRFTEDDIGAEPDRLAVEIQTVSMFSPQKIIRAQVSGRIATDLARISWDSVPETVRVVVESGNLKKEAKLRRVFEGGRGLVAMPCYATDDPGSLRELIREELADGGICIDRDAESYLAELIGGDPGIAKSEVAKLITYAHGHERISLDDVEAIVGDTSRITMDAAVDAILSGDAAASQRIVDKLQASGTPVDTVLSVLSQHLLRLIRLRARIDAGASADAALKGFRPPIHFRRADAMKRQIADWRRGDLRQGLHLTSRAIKTCRLFPQLDAQIATDLISRLAMKPTRRVPRR